MRVQAGQAMVELALTLGIVLFLVLGFADVIQWVGAQQSVAQAARSVATYAALTGGDAGPHRGARQLGLESLDAGFATQSAMATIAITCPGKTDPWAKGGCRRYDPITVEIRYRATRWVPFPWFGDQFTITHRVTRMSEQEGQP